MLNFSAWRISPAENSPRRIRPPEAGRPVAPWDPVGQVAVRRPTATIPTFVDGKLASVVYGSHNLAVRTHLKGLSFADREPLKGVGRIENRSREIGCGPQAW